MNNQTSEFMSPLDRAYNLKSIVDINTPWLNSLLDSWLNEDIGRGDLTNDALMG